jgi:hypothetical protein
MLHTILPLKDLYLFFETGMRFFPKKNGISLIFKKDALIGDTPFKAVAYNKFGYKRVMTGVEDTLARYLDTTPIDIVDVLIVAATDENVHLDCVCFLIRRRPDVLLKLLSDNDKSNKNKNNDSSSSNSNNNDGDNSVMNESLIVNDNPKK